MATIKLTGNAVVITSAVKYEDLALVQKFAPKKLTLMGGEDGKEEIFKIAVENGNGSISQYGAVYGSTVRDGEKLATITMLVSGETCTKEYIADKFGEALVNLSQLEATIPAVVDDIKAQRAAIIDSIEVA